MTSINKFLYLAAFMLVFASCNEDLNVVPIDPNEQTAATVYDDPSAYKKILAKMYAGLATTGQRGPAGLPDIAGIDEGFSSYLRMYWYHQELTTDEAVIAWNDQTIKDFHNQNWGSGDVFIQALYSRIFYQITFANEFLRETSEGKLNSRGVDDALKQEIQVFRAEARFLRAMSYWHAMDLFANVPFVTEDDAIGAFLPAQIQRADLFDYIESELLDIEGEMMAARQNEYARADRAAVWMLLAKLYLNAEVYTSTQRYSEAVAYSKQVIDAGYNLAAKYESNFMADNHNSPEIIFPVAFDGLNTQTFGGTTFIAHAAVGGNMSAGDFGLDGGWGGTRTTSAFVEKFTDTSGDSDSRAMFFTDGQALEINDISVFTDGWAITKWKNLDSNGNPGSSLAYVDIDFPVFRLADAYLMYAEGVLRGGTGGSVAEATAHVNELRQRAYGDDSGNISELELNLDLILDERARELFWESHRRTDLIRYGRFSESEYLWPWKGGVREGISTDSKYNVFPIPSSDLAANPNLSQNNGY
jgi:hypothetical protein